MSIWSFRQLVIGFGVLSVVGLGVTACGKNNDASDDPCKTGAEACRCYGNDSCDRGLTCLANLCLDLDSSSGGQISGAGGAVDELAGGAESVASSGAPAAGGTSGASGTSSGGTHANGGSLSSSGSSGLGGSLNSGGTTGMVDAFPPTPAACALVASCADCCETVGVFALDSLAKDATPKYVKAFGGDATSASAAFDFATSNEVGAIFFRFNSPQNIGQLQIAGQGTGGSLEVALVRANGKDGCIYPIIAGSLSSVPDSCWGLGAGPYAVLPADQIEVRVRSQSFGAAALKVTGLAFAP